MASRSGAVVKELLEGRVHRHVRYRKPHGLHPLVAVRYRFDATSGFVRTSSRSPKARNLRSKPTLSLMIDSRNPAASLGVTISGKTQILTGDDSKATIRKLRTPRLPQVSRRCRTGGSSSGNPFSLVGTTSRCKSHRHPRSPGPCARPTARYSAARSSGIPATCCRSRDYCSSSKERSVRPRQRYDGWRLPLNARLTVHLIRP